MKKNPVILIVMLLAAVFLVFGSACSITPSPSDSATPTDSSSVCAYIFAQYQADAKEALEAYALVQGQDNYAADNWTALLGLAAWGKTEINAATDKAGVNSALTAAKRAIRAVEAICVCGLEPEIKARIDFSDPKVIWDREGFDFYGQVDFDVPKGFELYISLVISVVFRRTHNEEPFPQFEVRHFNHANVQRVGYITFSSGRPSWWDDERYGLWRQNLSIALCVVNEVTIREAVRHLERLCFVKYVTPWWRPYLYTIF